MRFTAYIRRFPWFETALALIVMSIHLYAATADAFSFPGSWFTRDDAYYYFKVAQNIGLGHGSTFDGLNPTNGYHPLWMLVCVPIFALARFDLILPLRLLLVLQGALSAAGAILIYHLVREVLALPVAIVAGAWWAFNTYIHYTMYEFGLETSLAAFFVILLVYALYRFETQWRTRGIRARQLTGLAVLAAATLLSRLDLAFLALLAGFWIIFRGTRMRILMPLDVAIAVAAALAGFLYRLGLPNFFLYSNAAIAMAAFSVAAKVPIFYLLGLYQAHESPSLLPEIRKLAIGVTISSVAMAAAMLAISAGVEGFPRAALLYDWLFNIIGLILVRWLAMIFTASRPSRSAAKRTTEPANAKHRRREALLFYGIVGGVLAPYLLWNKIVIGSASPVSGEIKRWWGGFASRVYGGPARNPSSFWGVGFHNDFDAWRPFSIGPQAWARSLAAWWDSYKPELFYPGVLIGCGLIALLILLLNRRLARRAAVQLALPVLWIGSLAQILSYNATGYSGMKEWYWIGEPVFMVLSLSLLASILLKPLQKIPFANFALIMIAIVASFVMARDFSAWVGERMPHGRYAADLPYMDSVRFLEENTLPGAVIGMTGGGNVGYYIQDRTIVNMDGLINSPAYFEALKAGEAGDYLADLGVDYIFANPQILSGPPYRGQFKTDPAIARYGGKALMELAR